VEHESLRIKIIETFDPEKKLMSEVIFVIMKENNKTTIITCAKQTKKILSHRRNLDEAFSSLAYNCYY